MPGKIIHGKVAKISKLAKYLNERNPESLKYFDVDISIDEKLPGLKVNMNVEIKESGKDYVILEGNFTGEEKFYISY